MSGVSYSVYRFVYLVAIFKNKETQQEVLYFSWKLWGEYIEDGKAEVEVAELIQSAQIKCNSRLSSNTWGAKFSSNKVYNDVAREDSVSSDNVPVSIKQELLTKALAIVKTYEKKN